MKELRLYSESFLDDKIKGKNLYEWYNENKALQNFMSVGHQNYSEPNKVLTSMKKLGNLELDDMPCIWDVLGSYAHGWGSFFFC